MYQDPSLALRMTVGAGRDSACWQRIAVSGQTIAVSASGYRLPAFGCPLSHCLAVGFRLPAPDGRLPADRYLQADGSLSACTKILRCAQDDCGRREGGCLKSDVWCLNVSVLSGIPLSGQRIAVSGQLSFCPAGRQSRNAAFIFMAVGDTTTLTPKACQTLGPSAPQALSTL
jgi:hypothetical protein